MRSRALIFGALALLVLFVALPGVAGALRNGGFEDGSLYPAYEWNYNYPPHNGTTPIVTNIGPYSGSYCMYIGQIGQWEGWAQYLTLTNLEAQILQTNDVITLFAKTNLTTPRMPVITGNVINTTTKVKTGLTVVNGSAGQYIETANEWHFVALKCPALTRGYYYIELTFATESGSYTTHGHQIWADDIQVNYLPNVIAPTAAFNATPVSGQAPLAVTFADLSTGSPTSWLWDFGDNSTSTAQNPAHTYTAPGFYNVSLRASNSMGSDYENKTSFIVATEQAGSYSGYFRLQGNYSYTGGYVYNGFDAVLVESDPYDQFDRIVWYLDGSVISDSDVAASWVNHREVKNMSGTWKTYWSAYGDPWQVGGAGSWYLLNSFHFKTSGAHVLRATVFYQNVSVADVSLTVTAADLGSFSGNTIEILDSLFMAQVDDVNVSYTEVMTGATLNVSVDGYQYLTLVKGHEYRFVLSRSGYEGLIESYVWPESSGGMHTFVLVNSNQAPPNGLNTYVNIYVRDYNGYPIPGARVKIINGTNNTVVTVDSNGFKKVDVPQNTPYTWVAEASGMASKMGTFTTGTSPYTLYITLPVSGVAPTGTPSGVTPAPGGGGVYTPGSGATLTPAAQQGQNDALNFVSENLPFLVILLFVGIVLSVTESMGPSRRRK